MHLSPGTVAVVTGAASGIGQALTRALARRGCRIAAVDIDQDGLERLTADLIQIGADVSTHRIDVADQSQMERLPDAVLTRHGQVDLLINNAGVYVAGLFEHYSLKDLEWIVGVNFWGAVYGCRFFLPYLRHAQRAHIATILSDFALVGMPGKTAYCATKFALRGFCEALRTELYGSTIGLTCVYPCAVDTELIRRARAVNPVARDAEARFVAARALPAERIAGAAIRGIERRQARVLIGRDTYLLDLLARLAPGLTATLLGRFRDRVAFL